MLGHAELIKFADSISSEALLTAPQGTAQERAAITLAEQSLRLAAFFHDLGHLPFSHDFEYGLTTYWERSGAAQSSVAELFRHIGKILPTSKSATGFRS